MNLDIAYLEALEKEIAGLPPVHRIAFAASCCERLLPNYSAFAREEGWGNPFVLRAALDEVWQILLGQPADAAKIDLLRENCKNAILHDEEVFNSHHNYEAQLAAIAISNTLEACLDPAPKVVVKVIEGAVDTISEFIRIEKENADPRWTDKPFEEQNKEIADHPFTVKEIAKQSEDLRKLKEIEILDRDFLECLRTSSSSYNDGKSLIDLS